MRIDDIIKLGVTPLLDYEMEPNQVWPNGEWVFDQNTNKYTRSALVKDVIGSKINMRHHPVAKFLVQVFAVPNDGGTVTGGGEYNQGETAVIGAVANTGFIFKQWQDGDLNPLRDMIVNSDMNFIATFEPEQIMYTISVGVKQECVGYGTVQGGGTFPEGTNTSISAQANDHYVFDKWNDGYTTNPRTITVTRDAEYLAIFKAKFYDIKVKSSPETYGITTGTGQYTYGQTAHLTATPYPGYRFVKWNDNYSEQTRNVTVTGNATYTAIFERIPATDALITVKSNDTSLGTTNPTGPERYNIGQNLTITAEANEGCSFLRWQGTGAESMVDPSVNPYTFMVANDVEFEAVFEREVVPVPQYTVNISVDPTGCGNTFEFIGVSGGEGETEIGSKQFDEGDTCTLLAYNANGYRFDGWWQGNELKCDRAAYSFRVSENITLTAKFSRETPTERYRVRVYASPVAGGSVSGGGSYTHGESCTVYATPNTGYVFDDWMAGGSIPLGKPATYTFEVTGNTDLTALFDLITYGFRSWCEDPSGNTVLDRGTINVSMVGGTGTIEDSFRVDVTPYEGYELVGMEINGSSVRVGEDSRYEFNISDYAESSSNDTITVVAIFGEEHQPETYNVTTIIYTDGVESDAGGSVTGTRDGDWAEQTTITKHAIANSGYRFTRMTVNGATAGDDSFKLESDTTVRVYFVSQYTVNASADPRGGGDITVSGTIVNDAYDKGTQVIVVATASEGFVLDHWVVNDSIIENTPESRGQYVISSINKNYEIIAHFSPLTPTPTSCEITAAAKPDGSGTVTGGGTYNIGEQVTINATPNQGYTLDHWEKDDVEQDTVHGSSFTFTADGDTTVIAYFVSTSPTHYNIGVAVKTNGSLDSARVGGAVSGGGEIAVNQRATITATANTGYVFVGWEVPGETDPEDEPVSGSHKCSVVADHNKTVYACFESITYDISVNADPTAGGNVSGGGSYTYGQNVEVTATSKPNYAFACWKENNETVSTNATYSFQANKDRTLTAIFTQSHYNLQVKVYTGDAESNVGGTVTGNASRYVPGAIANLVAVPNAGYHFSHWIVDGTRYDGSTSRGFEVTKDNMIVTAYFVIDSYNISVNADPTAGGNVSGGGSYNYGQTVTVTASPKTNYTFVRWEEDGSQVSTNATYTFTANKNRTLTAVFAQSQYNLQVKVYTGNAESNVGGTVTGNSSRYTPGSTANLVAVPNTGYHFSHWVVDGVQYDNASRGFEVNKDNMVVTAYFVINTYNISVDASPNDGGDVSGSGSYNHGQTVEVTATPKSTYEFVRWKENGTQVSTEATYSFSANKDRVLTAVFTQSQYSLQVKVYTGDAESNIGGTVTGNSSRYTPNSTANLVATPNTGYHFSHWVVDGVRVDGDASRGFPVTKDNMIVVAYFEINSYDMTLNADPSEGGNVSGGGSYNYGQTVTVTASPKTNYTFVRWEENGSQVSTNATYSFTANKNRTLTAVFAQDQYSLQIKVYTGAAESNVGGTVTGNSSRYTPGSIANLVATPNTGYHFSHWVVDGTRVDGSASRGFEVTKDNMVVVAYFEINSYDMTLNADPSEGGNVSGSGSYNHGQSVEVTATAKTNYTFVRWEENGVSVSTDATYTFTANKSRTLTAVFAQSHYNLQVKVYTGSAESNVGGTVTGNSSRYTPNSTANLVATPNTGYHFDHWEVDGVQYDNASRGFPVTKDNMVVIAYFTINTYNITANADPTAGGNVSGGGSYNHGQTVTVTASPKTNYEFARWEENNEPVSTDATYSFTADKNRTLTAIFSQSQYGIQVKVYTGDTESNTGGTVTGSAGRYTPGSTANLVATPATGYHFDHWVVDGTRYDDSASRGFEVTKDNMVVAAYFVINSYNITVNADPTAGGNVSGGGSYNHGQTVEVTASPKTNYAFARWEENNETVSTDATYSFTADKNRTLTAVFTQSQYGVQVKVYTDGMESSVGGTVTGNAGRYNPGSTANLVATPNTGYHFDHWVIDGTRYDGSASRGFEVTKDNMVAVAYFAIDTYDITVNADPTAGGDVSGGGSYNHGQTVEVTASPKTNYTFVRWNENGTQVSTNATYSFIAGGDRTLTAVFAKSQYDVQVKVYTGNAESNVGGTVTGNSSRYTPGSVANLVATPNTGYHFDHWVVDGVQYDNASRGFEVNKDNMVIIAYFAINTYDITVNADPVAGGDVSGGGSYNYGQSVQVTAAPKTGYTFVRWDENGTQVSTSATYSFTTGGDRTLTAVFAQSQYSLQVKVYTGDTESNVGGTVTGNSSRYTPGSVANLVATPNTGYHFDHWVADGTRYDGSASRGFEVNKDNMVVTAYFAINSYDITVNADPVDGGNVSGGGSYNHGQSVQVTAVSKTNYTFVRWEENNESVSTDTTYTFTANKNRTLTAVFAQSQYSLQVKVYTGDTESNVGGTVTGNASRYTPNSTANLVATPNTGYHLDHWVIDGVRYDGGASRGFPVTKDNMIAIAYFAINTYTITANTDPADGGSVSGGGSYDHGQTVEVTATPKTDYEFVRWEENGASVSTNETYSFTANSNRTLTAIFAETVHDYSRDYLTLRVTDPGTINWTSVGGSDKAISYSIDGGSWTEIRSSNNPSIPVTAGQVVRFKGTETNYCSDRNIYSAFKGGTAKYAVEGNIMSLIHGDNFIGQTQLTTDWVFANLFNGALINNVASPSNVISAENLILPAMTLSKHCYRAMFANCSLLVTPPVLPATVLKQRCYSYMFDNCVLMTTAPELPAPTLVTECYYGLFHGCTSLNYIKCLATTGFNTSNCLDCWVQDVAATGVFVKDANTTWSVTGIGGIPSGWTVKNDGEDDGGTGGDDERDDEANEGQDTGELGTGGDSSNKPEEETNGDEGTNELETGGDSSNKPEEETNGDEGTNELETGGDSANKPEEETNGDEGTGELGTGGDSSNKPEEETNGDEGTGGLETGGDSSNKPEEETEDPEDPTDGTDYGEVIGRP